ncbi:transcriptional regulator [Bacterioplanes sanyensis]|uniref:Transcriptional regulator n=1 Tax=Bacterioplanes sanyensis TaxID=1249553 RepID=A0A222FNS6_9GAMM|nr:helix-turn-helix domain-containing protein [Bacterioplanes sanyensis]ASP40667.1 transcriptional regulator [Bacterioplanes sanyensis]
MNENLICPLAQALDIIGDRWTLLVVRDLLQGKSRYNEFSASSENIPTNILANRLKRLIEQGLVEKQPYQQRPIRYQYALTDKGMGLLPAVQQLVLWAQQHYPHCRDVPAEFLQRTP